MPLSSESGFVAHFGVFAAHLSARKLYKHGVEIRLQEQPFKVLALLLERPGKVVSREELRQQLWPTDTFVAFDEGLNAAVNRLRRALADSAENPRFIETIHRQGYRFIAPIDLGEQKAEEVRTAAAQLEEPTGYRPAWKSSERKPWVRMAAVVAFIAVAAGVVYSLRHSLAKERRAEAVREYQLGRDLWKRRNPESLAQAIEHYNKAVALDPSYAPAYSGLADDYLMLPFLSPITVEESYPKAREAAAKALALDDSLAEAHTSEADVKLYMDWDFAGAEREFRRALGLNPNYATAHQWYAEYLSLMGRNEEAIREIERAMQLEPLSVIMYHEAGQTYQNARQYDKAIEQYNKALAIDSTFYPSGSGLAEAFRRKGRYPEAIQMRQEFLKRNASFYDPEGVAAQLAEKTAAAYAAGGEKAYWRALLEDEQQQHEHHPVRGAYRLAVYYSQLGDIENGLLWLNKAYQQRALEILGLKGDPDLDPLRLDPRFDELVRKVGLP